MASLALNGSLSASFLPAHLPAVSSDDKVAYPIVGRIVQQFVHNVVLLKVRFMGLGEVPLSADEEAVILRDDRTALDRLSLVAMEEMSLLEESLKSAPWGTVEGRAMDSINSVFRFTFEELLLRWKACAEKRAAKFASQSLLTTAVDHQRKLIDEANAAKLKAETSLSSTQQALADAKRRVQQLESEKKTDFDAYIREVCVLKEQLYRSYKDKNYVGKPVDLLRLVQDDDEGDDVSVDELLRCRRQMRTIEAETNALKEQIVSLQADISGKARFIKRLEERCKAAEGVAQALQGDVENLNLLANKLEASLADARSEATTMRNTVQKLEQAERERQANVADFGVQTEAEKTTVSKYDVGAEHIPMSHRESSRLQLFMEIGEREKVILQLRLEHEEFAKKGLAEIKRLEAALTETQDKLDEATADLAVAQATIIARNAEIATLKTNIAQLEAKLQAAIEAARQAEIARAAAEAARLEAEARAEDAMNKCVEQTKTLSLEVAASTKALETAQKRNTALSRAFLNVNDKLEDLKSRAGLRDYKRRANEFHFKRAEAIIKASRAEVETREAACVKREEEARAKAELANNMLAFALEDIKEQERVHVEETKQLIKRTAEVQDAFEALLMDFNRLRDDYLKAAGSTAMEHLKSQGLAAGLALTTATSAGEESTIRPGPRYVFEASLRGVNISAADDKILQVAKFALEAHANDAVTELPKVEEAAEGEDGTGVDLDDAAKRHINHAALSLAPRLTRDYSRFFHSVHTVFATIYELDRAVQAKEFSIAAAEKAVAQTMAPPIKGGKAAPVKKKTLAEEHAKFVAHRDLAAERAGLQEQKIVAAWQKIKLLAELDLNVREAFEAARNTMLQSGLLKPEGDEIPNQGLQLMLPPTAADGEDSLSPSPHQSPKAGKSGARGVGFRQSPGDSTGDEPLPRGASSAALIRKQSSRTLTSKPRPTDTPDSEAVQSALQDTIVAPLPTNAVILAGLLPAARRGSTGELPKINAPWFTSKWGDGRLPPPAPSAVPTDMPRSRPAMLAAVPPPASTFGARVVDAMDALPVLPEISLQAASQRQGLLSRSSESMRPSTRAAAVEMPAMLDASPFGDPSGIDSALAHLRDRLAKSGKSDAEDSLKSSNVPLWRRHKEKLRLQSRGKPGSEKKPL